MREILAALRQAVGVELFTIAGTPVTGATLLTAVAIVVVTFRVSALLQRGSTHFLNRRGVRDEGSVGVTSRLIHYLVVVVGLGIAFDTIGINLTALFAAGAFLAVALGFAMQNITQNFVSGVILLTERSIKPGDVLEIEGVMVKVRHMGIRSTVARTLEDEDLIIPNSVLVQSTVKNYTLRDTLCRVRGLVGVEYRSDMKRVREVLEAAALEVPGRAQSKEPVVFMNEFGSSSVDFEVSVWIDDPWQRRGAHSRLNEAIWWKLKEAGITIAFPQVDVHFDAPVTAALGASGPSP